MAQGVAWVARDLGVECTVVAPEHAPAAKLEAIERLGGRTMLVPYETLVGVDVERDVPGARRASSSTPCSTSA